MTETASTKSAALALADERVLMRQGYQFLDEKRMLLAAEMLRRLAEHEALRLTLAQQLGAARTLLQGALQRHGLEGLLAYPPVASAPRTARIERTLFLGVPLVAATPAPHKTEDADTSIDAVDASPQARACGAAFRALLAPLARLAACSNDLERLAVEYRRTERRARALENVLLPEIESALATIDGRLELADQEEAVRTRLTGRHR
jgi:V/A-type H+-transporting ATPase subunit D